MMVKTLDVRTGFLGTWIDYDRTAFQRQLFTFSNKDAGIWTNFIAVDLTLATPLVFVLFQRLIEVIWTGVENWNRRREARRLQRAEIQRAAATITTEESPLLENVAPIAGEGPRASIVRPADGNSRGLSEHSEIESIDAGDATVGDRVYGTPDSDTSTLSEGKLKSKDIISGDRSIEATATVPNADLSVKGNIATSSNSSANSQKPEHDIISRSHPPDTIYTAAVTSTASPSGHNDVMSKSFNSHSNLGPDTNCATPLSSNEDLRTEDRDIEAGAVSGNEIGDTALHERPISITEPLTLRQTFMTKKTPQAAAAKLAKILISEVKFSDSTRQHRDWRKIAICFFLAIFCTVLFSVLTYATIMSAQIASDPIVLSDSSNCGVWIVDPRITFLSPFNYMQEVESGDVAKRCYGKNNAVGECNNFFVEPSFPIEETNNATCPFKDGFCLEGNASAYTLDTGLISSRSLGINVPIGYTFNRSTTCAPVQRKGYVGLDESMRFIEYYYGPHAGLTDNNLTWLTPLFPTLSDSGYNVDPFCSVHSKEQGWQPRDELRTVDGSTITLLIVTSKKNFHMERRDDPIFPARRPLLIGGDITYVNDDPISTVLACTDKTTMCDASGSTCWDPVYDPPPEHTLPGRLEKDGYFMMQVALLRSRLCHSIKFRGGNALDAQTKINVYTSLPLATEQWKVEARNLFAASLARVQIDLRDYARGNAAKEPGFTDYMDPEFKGMCKMYKFRGLGYTNLSVWPFTSLLLGSIVIFVMSFKGNVTKEINGENVVKRKFVVEILLLQVCRCCVFLFAKFRDLVNIVGNSITDLMVLVGRYISSSGHEE